MVRLRCQYLYCHGSMLNAASECRDHAIGAYCTTYCRYFVMHADPELLDKQVKNLNSTEPARSVYECSDK